MISQEKLKILTRLQKLPKNVGDLGKIIVAKGFEKSNKSPNLVTLPTAQTSKYYKNPKDRQTEKNKFHLLVSFFVYRGRSWMWNFLTETESGANVSNAAFFKTSFCFHLEIGLSVESFISCNKMNLIVLQYFFKNGLPRTLFVYFRSFSNKQHNFYKKMWIKYSSSVGMRTHSQQHFHHLPPPIAFELAYGDQSLFHRIDLNLFFIQN